MSLDKFSLLDDYIYQYLKALDCPRSLTCWLLYSNNEHKALSELAFDPHFYNEFQQARDSLAATKFLSKAKFLKTGNDLKGIAIEKFFEAEQICKETNRRLYRSTFESLLTEDAILRAAAKIEYILGNFCPDELLDACNWGPGATTLIKRREATHPKKYDLDGRITSEAYDFVAPWFRMAYPLWDVKFEICGASKIVTVPKDAKSDRTIAIEPGLNLWFQKGVGTLIRKRLKRIGIDLNYQRINQEKSRLASLFNDTATVDFSMASDTISKALVERLLPSRWLSLMQAFRSSYGTLEGQIVYFEKFSSMGNGFTFELESLIFYSLACAICEIRGVSYKDVSIYGDDLIIPSSTFDIFSIVVKDLGFTVNKSKSYFSSYYRESCGSHYWDGRDIKPIFQKETLDAKVEILRAANAVRRQAHNRNNHCGCDSRLRRCWSVLVRALGTSVPMISDGYGDLGLIVNLDELKSPPSRAKHECEGYRIRVWATLAHKITCESNGMLLFKLRSMGTSEIFDPLNIDDVSSIGNNIPIPCRTRLARVSLSIPRWYDLGYWH